MRSLVLDLSVSIRGSASKFLYLLCVMHSTILFGLIRTARFIILNGFRASVILLTIIAKFDLRKPTRADEIKTARALAERDVRLFQGRNRFAFSCGQRYLATLSGGFILNPCRKIAYDIGMIES